MRENKVKRKLDSGGVALGVFIFEFSTTGIARTAASAGAEFILWDMEHTGWSIETIRSLSAAARASDIVPCVRPPATESDLIARALDVGAMGLMIPNVKTEEQARTIVRYAKYPPVGDRSVGFLYSDDLEGDGDVLATMEKANREHWLIALIESVEGVENADKIAAVDGIDTLWIGHFDLTASMGIPGQFKHPDYLAAVDHLLEVSRRQDKALGFMVTSADQGRESLAKGFRCLSFGDIFFFQQSLREVLGEIRSSV